MQPKHRDADRRAIVTERRFSWTTRQFVPIHAAFSSRLVTVCPPSGFGVPEGQRDRIAPRYMLDENLKLVLAPEQSPFPAVAGTPGSRRRCSCPSPASTRRRRTTSASHRCWRTADSSTACGSSRRARSSVAEQQEAHKTEQPDRKGSRAVPTIGDGQFSILVFLSRRESLREVASS
jgi:hypothetical protein